MNNARTLGRMMAALAAALVFSPSVVVRAQTESADAYGDAYQSGDHGRVRYADGGALILRASSESDREERAGTNAPVFPGDALRTADAERVEIELSAGSLLRVDRNAQLTFQSLPSPYAKFRDNTVLTLDGGSIQVVAKLEENDEFRIDTPSASVYLLGDGDFRIDASADQTRVYSRRGVAEVVGEGGSVLVRGGTRTNAYRGIIPEDPRAFNSYTADAFDRWVVARDDAYKGHERLADDGAVAELPEEVQPYYRELSSSGDWVEDDTYGQVWYPSAVPSGWRPYGNGYWHYGPGGYFWVSYDPWGWAPYRYGRWSWFAGYGWGWIPGHVYAGAWVSWSWGSTYYGWAPLDYWGYPAYVHGHYYHGHYDPGCWTFVDHHQMGHHDGTRHAIPVDKVPRGGLDGNVVVSRPPNVPPRRLAESREWRDRAARSAASDPTIRMKPIARDRTPDRALRNVEDRLLRRTPARDLERRNDTPRAARTGSPAAEREGAGRSADAQRFPRRVSEDPRGRVSPGRPSAPSREESTPAPNGPREPRAVDRDRRSLYDRVSRPRDVTEGENGREPARVQPRVQPRETPREQPREQPRVQPRETPREQPRAQPKETPRETPREQPRAQPKETPRERPREQPRAAPERQEPRRQQMYSPRVEPRRQQLQAPRSTPRRESAQAPRSAPRRESVQAPRSTPRRESAQAPRPAPRTQPSRSTSRSESKGGGGKTKSGGGGGGGKGKRGGR